MNILTQLRYDRTRKSNQVRRHIQWMLTSSAPHLGPDGLPSWWPFWADSLVADVRQLTRAARRLQAKEEMPS